jgi:signal transduction histidine kinase
MDETKGNRSLKVSVHPSTSVGFVDIEVQDNGKGIPPEDIDKVLDPYFTSKPDGTGLGLAMAYKIIDEHNGTIRFQSQPGQGTTVTVSLPVE